MNCALAMVSNEKVALGPKKVDDPCAMSCTTATIKNLCDKNEAFP